MHVPDVRTWTSLGDHYSVYRVIGLTINNADLTYTEYSHSVPDSMLTSSHGSLHVIFTTVPWGKYYSTHPIIQINRLYYSFPFMFPCSFPPSSSFRIIFSSPSPARLPARPPPALFPSLIYPSLEAPHQSLLIPFVLSSSCKKCIIFSFTSLVTCFPTSIHTSSYPYAQLLTGCVIISQLCWDRRTVMNYLNYKLHSETH